jgi:hypothetical protein
LGAKQNVNPSFQKHATISGHRFILNEKFPVRRIGWGLFEFVTFTTIQKRTEEIVDDAILCGLMTITKLGSLL